MGLSLNNLDDITRRYMLDEFDADLATGTLYLSKWFSEGGSREYPRLGREAIEYGSDDTLAQSLNGVNAFVESYEKRTKSGGWTTAAVPYTAATTFAEGEFNRFYLRGLCVRLIAEGGEVEIYRARSSAQARSASAALIGSVLSPGALLADLRASQGVDTALGLPPGPNSGLSGRRA